MWSVPSWIHYALSDLASSWPGTCPKPPEQCMKASGVELLVSVGKAQGMATMGEGRTKSCIVPDRRAYVTQRSTDNRLRAKRLQISGPVWDDPPLRISICATEARCSLGCWDQRRFMSFLVHFFTFQLVFRVCVIL